MIATRNGRRRSGRSLALAALLLGGCTHLEDTLDTHAERMVGAAPLSLSYTLSDKGSYTQASVPPTLALEYIGDALTESMTKCVAFTARLAVSQTGIDTTFDIGALITSGLATALKPLGTSHALSAASTILTGTKSTLDADIYAKNTAPMIIQQIQGTYFKEYRAYVDKLPTSSIDATGKPLIIVPVEVAKIQGFHNDCSLELAVAAITNDLKKNSSTTVVTYTDSDLKAGVKFLLPFTNEVDVVTSDIDAAGNVKVVVIPPGKAPEAEISVQKMPFLLKLINNSATKL